MCEESKQPGDGAGLCPGYTISRAILSDAVALTRGDRFLTTDLTRMLFHRIHMAFTNTPIQRLDLLLGDIKTAPVTSTMAQWVACSASSCSEHCQNTTQKVPSMHSGFITSNLFINLIFRFQLLLCYSA